MIEIIKNENSWSFKTAKRKITGAMSDILIIALEIGIEEDELVMAFSELDEKCHTKAQFGINRTLIYTE